MPARPTSGDDRAPAAPPDDEALAWTRLADVLLQRAALVARVIVERPPNPLAGLKIDDAEVDRLLGELPGLEARDPSVVDELEAATAAAVAEARDRLAAAAGSDAAFARLARAAALDPLETEALAVLCAVEVDARRQRLVAYLNDDVTQRRLTPWSLAQVLGAGALPAVGPGGGLRRAGLLLPAGDAPWASVPLAVAPAVAWWLTGSGGTDPDLPPGVEWLGASGTGAEAVVVASGPDRLRRLEAVAGSLRATRLLVTPLPDGDAQWDAVVRQATLWSAGVVLELEGPPPPVVVDRLQRARHLAWGLTSPADLPLDDLPRSGWRELAVGPARASAEEWRRVLDEEPTHPLSAEQLDLVARASAALGGDLPSAVRRLAAGHMDTTATKVAARRGWDDLVLEAERLDLLADIARRGRHRDTVFGSWGFSPVPSTGVVALFAGPPGTGKTLAAEVIAHDLGVDLYKIDLANLVSKYIGETEKNLSRVFDAAEASNVVLFLDEADALLSRRSEVSDAHDRYANLETAYLLQRLERYEGVAVLATNLAKNIDPAFLRRLHVVVEFPMPGPAERRRIWARSLPDGAPRGDDLDLDTLADQFEISGGTIRNALLGAAFLAADAGTPITMATAVTALSRELKKIGRLVSPEDFDRYADLLDPAGGNGAGATRPARGRRAAGSRPAPG